MKGRREAGRGGRQFRSCYNSILDELQIKFNKLTFKYGNILVSGTYQNQNNSTMF
jgi:hypothetical protein